MRGLCMLCATSYSVGKPSLSFLCTILSLLSRFPFLFLHTSKSYFWGGGYRHKRKMKSLLHCFDDNTLGSPSQLTYKASSTSRRAFLILNQNIGHWCSRYPLMRSLKYPELLTKVTMRVIITKKECDTGKYLQGTMLLWIVVAYHFLNYSQGLER